MYFATKRPNTVNYRDTIHIVIILQLSIVIVIVALSLGTNNEYIKFGCVYLCMARGIVEMTVNVDIIM